MNDKTLTVTVVGRRCVYINDYRVAGSKPYVSENLPSWSFEADINDLRYAIGRRPSSANKALQSRIEALEADLVEWKNQHENLLSVRQQDIAAMQAKIDILEKELAFKNEAIRLTKGCPGKIVVRGGFYKIDCYKSKHSKQALEGSGNG